ncbi:fat-like cadherin-related tumor suppressor homolog, partial [Hyalella azteca]|uniref:Fat-like cadherin-related tumor suppressor homolog n=1 Tax=Hyalella azteca TaxID=294128 RepID=A0A979FG29_HYAAZ
MTRQRLRKRRSSEEIRFTSSYYNASVPENAPDNTPVVSDEMMGVFLPSESFKPVYSVEVSEDTPIYSSIIKVHADDPDTDLNGKIYYRFREESSTFVIHPHLGIVTSTRTLNFHEKSVYNFTLMARDRGSEHDGHWPAEAKLVITVQEVNVFEPQMKVSLLEEMSHKGHLLLVAIVTVLDNDEGVSGLVDSLEIVDGDPERVFRIIPSEETNEFSLAALGTIDWVSRPLGYNLTLKATDRGTIARFSYKDIFVAPPKTTKQQPSLLKNQYEFNISEAAPPGSFVGILGYWIPGTSGEEVYFLSEDNKVREFAVEPTSGTLTTVIPLDAETVSSYSFQVLAKSKDQSGVQMTEIKIHVIDANDNTPMIVAPQGVVQMNENLPANTWVVKVRAQDYDFGKNGAVSYSLANSENVPFKIDHFTGEVRSTKVLDYESGRRIWKLLVRASDWGEPFRRQTEKIITIHVQDVNDNRPQFERVDCSGYIDRSAPLGTEIMTLSAIDFDAGNIISYRILSGNNDRCFDVDSVKGVISLMCDLQDMEGNERFLNVTATDGQNFADSMNVRLQLIHSRSAASHTPWVDLKCSDTFVTKTLSSLLAESAVNNEVQKYASKAANLPLFSTNHHPPVFNNPPKEVRVRENSEIGTIILTLEANDVDTGYDGYLAFAISSGNHQSVFRIDVDSGNLIIVGELDRESRDKYVLNLTVFDLGVPQKSSSHELVVIIVDENDNIPKFDKVAYSFFLPESVGNGTNVHQLRAVDPDSGRFGAITYSLITDTKDFWMNPSTGLLSVSGSLDYETIEEYELRVVATDGGGLSSQAYIMVQVADVNDCAPQFFDSEYLTVKVSEDAPVGSLVILMYAYDSDSSNLRYFIDEGSTTFSIDENSGAIRVAEPLDYELRLSYNISIRATDDGFQPLSTRTSLTIEVLDVNENIHAPTFGRDVAEVRVPESLPPHSLLLAAPAVDGDINPLDAAITYSILGQQSKGLFYIDQQGDIYSAGWLDRESQAHYWLTIRATDSGTSPLHSTLHVYIEILDVNDNIPVPDSPSYSASVTEGAAAGTFVVGVTASDPDLDSVISYSFGSGNERGHFNIDPQTGVITTTGITLDREQQEHHTIQVVIRDNPDPTLALSSSVDVFVRVLDVNDNVPSFLQESYNFSVPFIEGFSSWSGRIENDAEAFAGQVVAGDLDAGDNGRVTYRLQQEAQWQGLFRVHPVSGVVTMRHPTEAGKIYTLAIRAEDQSSPARWSSVEVHVEITVTSEPQSLIELQDSEIVRLTVADDVPVGYLIHSIKLKKLYSTSLWYNFIDGSSAGALALDNRGGLLVAGKLAEQRQRVYNVSIEVSDGFSKLVARLTVDVMWSNPERPRFIRPRYQVDISESTKPGVAVLALEANRDNSASELLYKVEGVYHPNDLDHFAVQPSTGELILAQSLDREVRHQHVLLISVTNQKDARRKKDYCHVFIQVLDHNDHAPQFSSAVYNASVSETAVVGSRIVQLWATDKDHGANGLLVYSIASGNIDGAIGIDPESGLVFLQRTLERRQISNLVLSIRASDQGSPPLHSFTTVRIAIHRPKEAQPRFLRSSTVLEVSEAARVGDYIGVLQVDCPDGLQFTLDKNLRALDGRAPVLVNPSSGMVILDAPLDYERQQSYNMTVTATSMSGAWARTSLILAVRDENDNAPSFSKNNYWGEISEAAPIGSVVTETLPPAHWSSSYHRSSEQSETARPLVITAHDLDSDHNANLYFEIVDLPARNIFKIDHATGAIRSARALDHEQESRVQFRVAVRDSGVPVLAAAALAVVVINITDVNDVAPRFLQQEYDANLWQPSHA